MDEPQKAIDDAASRLVTTQAELLHVEALLRELPARKARLLGADVLDEKELNSLEVQESVLTKKQETLRARLPILAQQVEVEGARHAQLRITKLVAESAERAREYEQARQAFRTAATQLKQASDKLVGAYLGVQSSHDEQEYYVERYSGLTRAELSGPSERMPDEKQTADEALKPIKEHWQRTQMPVGLTPWSRMVATLRDQKWEQRQRTARASVGGHVRATNS